MKFTNIKQLIIKFMGGGIINFPTRFLRWVKIEGDTDGSDDGGGDSGGGQVEMIKFKIENFPLNDQNVLLDTVDRQKGYTLEEIFDKGVDVVQMLVDLHKRNAQYLIQSGLPNINWWNVINFAMDYQGPLGDYPRQMPTCTIAYNIIPDNPRQFDLTTTTIEINSEDGMGGSGPGVQIYFKEGTDGKWYMYGGWSVTAQ